MHRDRELTSLLAECLQEVLESMCFTMVDGEADALAEPAIPRVEVDLQFRGLRGGRFWLSFPAQTAQDIASAFTGIVDPDRDKVGEVMSELGNMTCGTTLSRMAADQLFELESPAARWITEPPEGGHSAQSINRVNFMIGPEVISAAIQVGDTP
jgi:CheY-specific phosphatase CheX